ncbi:MAG TPA: TetR/AcrR family transcriptional regulator [Steroidobacteraceae bacterium]|nr:TetR/AcrR family transcriptional regulator [Steroidobacteraceae bacterium]
MPNSASARPGRRPAARRLTTAAAREPRGARRKRQTRSRLLQAALQLMAEKGMEGVAINEITEAADVGFGSFYNHFKSKEAIHAALVDWVFEGFADAMDRLVSGISDPAEVISVSVRRTLQRARGEPVWGRFLMREGLSPRAMDRGLGRRLLRDMKRGIAARRFTIVDPLMSFVAVGGIVLVAIAVQLQFGSPQARQAAAAEALGFDSDNIPERAAAAALQTLGLGRREAERIAYRPLPSGDWQGALAAFGGVPQDAAPLRSAEPRARRNRRGSQRGAPA